MTREFFFVFIANWTHCYWTSIVQVRLLFTSFLFSLIILLNFKRHACVILLMRQTRVFPAACRCLCAVHSIQNSLLATTVDNLSQCQSL